MGKEYGRFHVPAIAASLPEESSTLLVDRYMTDGPGASTRVFRVYRGTPPHYHENSDEHLYVLSGRGSFWLESPENLQEFGPGDFFFFKKKTVHAMPELFEEPVVFLALDTPRREPADVVFVRPEDGTPEGFIRGDETRDG